MASSWTPAGGGQTLAPKAKANSSAGTFTPTPATTPAAAPAATAAATGITYDEQKRLDEANASASLLQQQQQQDYETKQARNSTRESVQAAFAQYGLSSLFSKIEEYVQQDKSPETIAILLRQTPEYKQRFPAMEALAAKGHAISEASYVDYERTAAALEQRYGFPKGMISGNVTSLLTNEVSTLELQDRAVLSSADAISAPDDFKQQMKDYYGIDQTGLAAYYFDPEKALPLLQKQSAIARIGTEGTRAGIGLDVSLAGRLNDMGVTEAEARQNMGKAASALSFTAGPGETMTQPNVVTGTFGDAAAGQQMERVGGSRVAGFQQGGRFVESKSGVSGLGASG